MYEAFFGFRERPFQLTPNPRFLFLNPAHREALATLRYGLTSSLGITLLLGDAGTGKTTLLHAALQAERRPEHRYALLSNPTLAPADFYEILAEAFRLPGTSGSKGRFLLAFERDLLERHRAGGLTALVVDEAQSLSHELFEEIRLLANLETETAKLVNVVLVGQRELAGRLNNPALRQFKQRVILRCALPPLDLESAASYIAARLRVAGAEATDVFTRAAVGAIYDASGGNPRVIGVICENALLAAYAAQRKPIDRAIITAVCRDFDLPVNGNGQPSRDARSAPGAGVFALDAGVAGPNPGVSAPDPGVAGPNPGVATQETRPPVAIRVARRKSRSWFSSRSNEPRPERAEEEPAAYQVRDRTRIFNFFQ